MEIFRDRRHAGQILAKALRHVQRIENGLVLALPRGGVPVGYEVAHALELPLDVFIVRKLGLPGREELAFGAIASGGVRIIDSATVKQFHVSDEAIRRIEERERLELLRREELYRGKIPSLNLANKSIIIVDDGLATGASMLAAVEGVRKQNPKEIIVAVPVASTETCRRLQRFAERLECICATNPEPFWSVGTWYENFAQTSDEEVRKLLALRKSEIEADRLTA